MTLPHPPRGQSQTHTEESPTVVLLGFCIVRSMRKTENHLLHFAVAVASLKFSSDQGMEQAHCTNSESKEGLLADVSF